MDITTKSNGMTALGVSAKKRWGKEKSRKQYYFLVSLLSHGEE